jgi:hypothetical protein
VLARRGPDWARLAPAGFAVLEVGSLVLVAHEWSARR